MHCIGSFVTGTVPSEGVINDDKANMVRSFEVSSRKPLLQNKGRAANGFPHTFSGYPLGQQQAAALEDVFNQSC